MADYHNYNDIQFTISCSLFYETLLMLVRGETLIFSKRKARTRRNEEKKTIDEISRIKQKFDESPDPENAQRLEHAQRTLEELRKPKIQGLIVRSKVRWYEDGEACSKFFLSLEKRNSMRTSIQSLKINNRVITDNEKILQHFSENLANKYCRISSIQDPSQYLSITNEKLTEAQKEALEAPISLQELHIALQSMKKGKTPGSNGFTSDF